MIEYIFNALTTVGLIFIGWLVRKISNLEEEIMNLKASSIRRSELNETITVKQEAIKVLQNEQKDDIKRIEAKLDRVIELITKG